MAYQKTLWKNKIVERPKTFRLQQNADGTVTLKPEFGKTIEEGTPVNAENMNNIEQGIENVSDDFASHLADYASFKNNIEAIRYVDEKMELKINGEWVEFKGKDGYPVGNVAGLSISVGNSEVAIRWQDPDDVTIKDSLNNTITISRWKGTKLVRKAGSYPINEADGALVLDNATRNKYQTNGYKDTGLTNGTTYYYMLFPYTEENVVTIDSANRISATPTEIDPDTWAGVQKIVRKGLASEYFNVGDQLVSAYDGGEIVWEVIGIDVDTPVDSNFSHSMTLQTKDCPHDIQFDALESNNPNSSRKSYGNNRYIHSAVRQWLNSDEAAFQWKSQHQYDAKPTDSLGLYNGAGFLHRLDPELVSVLGAANKKVAKADADGGGQESFNDKVFLLSQKEVGLGEAGDVTGEFVYPFYDGISNAGRIKQLNGINSSWWLRSPYVSTSDRVHTVYTDGSLNFYDACDARGVSPACVII